MFVVELCRRFGENNKMGLVEKFNKLNQKGTTVDYLDRFEELRLKMLTINPNLNKNYFI